MGKYFDKLIAEAKARKKRLSKRAPEAGPIKPKPAVKIIPLHNGKQIFEPTPPPPSPLSEMLTIIDHAPRVDIQPRTHRIPIAIVMRVVADAYGVKPKRLCYKGSRAHDVVRPRQVAMYVARKIGGASLPMIGRRIGDFDHTTVMHAVQTIESLMTIDDHLAATIEDVQRTLGAFQ